MSKAIILQQVAHEGPGRIVPVFRDFGIPTEIRHLYRGDEVPTDLDDLRVLVVMGGPMGVADVGNEKYPFLAKEVELLQRMVRHDRPVLGICLGAQLLAHAAGAKVYPNVKMAPPSAPGHPPQPVEPLTPLPEIGWLPVNFPFPAGPNRSSWGRTMARRFSIGITTRSICPGCPRRRRQRHRPLHRRPAGNALLSSTKLCRNQAYRFKNRLFGFQYHIEITPEGIEALVSSAPDEVTKVLGPDGQKQIRQDTAKYYPLYDRLSTRILQNFVQFLKVY